MLTFYGTGMILGAGIYSVIGQAAGIGGNGLWQGFLLAAISALITALSYAELAAMFPQAGGEYVYLRRAFPSRRRVAGTVGIVVIFAGCSSAATVALAFASYLNHFVPVSHLSVAAGLLLVFTGVNILGIRQASWINAAFTSVEVAGLILFIGLGWQSPSFGHALLTMPSGSMVSSAALLLFAYFGFENIVNLAEEAREPTRSIPRAILLSLTISTVLYLLVSLAAVALMPPEQLAGTEAAIADAAATRSVKVAGVLGGIALFSTANTALIALITTTRLLYGLARDRFLPVSLTRILKKRKTPWIAAIASFGLSCLFLPIGKVEMLASVASLTTLIAFIAVNVALLVLRKREPQRTRPFRVPFAIRAVPILPLIGVTSALIFISRFSAFTLTIGLIVLSTSGLAVFLTETFRKQLMLPTHSPRSIEEELR